jgi:hypothetical protein
VDSVFEASCVSSAGGFSVGLIHSDSNLSNEFDCSISQALTKPTFQAAILGPSFCGGGNRPAFTIRQSVVRLIGISLRLFGSWGLPTS